MEIEIVRKPYIAKRISDIETGKCFLFNGKAYIKTPPLWNNHGFRINAVSISEGKVIHISNEKQIKPIKKITLEEL